MVVLGPPRMVVGGREWNIRYGRFRRLKGFDYRYRYSDSRSTCTVTALIIENAPNLRTVIFGEIPNLFQREPSWLRNPNLPVVIQYNGED